MKKLIIYILSNFISFLICQQSVGRPCNIDDPLNVCPFKDACVKYNGDSIICVCRLAHKFPNGSWEHGFENCTNNYSPWSMYPYENGTIVNKPDFEYDMIPDIKVISSSSIDGYLPHYGRLDSFLGGKGAWCGLDDSGEWIQVDLGVTSTISMIGTQGGGISIAYTVKTFLVKYSTHPDGTDVSMTTLINNTGHNMIFKGNTDTHTKVYNFFTPYLQARYLRLVPLEKQNLKCIRLEIYGNREMNECVNTEEWNQCSEFASCTDTISSYQCTCFAGYHDVENNGFYCMEVNECKTALTQFKHNCSKYSTCANEPGFFTCTCFHGYEGDGYYCEDINECLNAAAKSISLCHIDAECVNVPGSYMCKCKPGYSGNGNSCNDENECKTGVAKCHEDALCVNTIGSFYCECLIGYEGNGTLCEDINECDQKPCHADAACTNSKGTFYCLCTKGFEGNGKWCDDMNECENGIAECSIDEYCYNTRGEFFCMCPRVMPLQKTYKEIENSILDHVLQNFRDSTKEDWRFPLDHHAHIIRILYQLVMRTYNYHFLETRDQFYIIKVAGNAFGIELYDLGCKDVANVSFPSLCHNEYKTTKFINFTDVVDIWLVRETEPVFETWGTAPPPKQPNLKMTTKTPLPIITFPLRTTQNITAADGSIIHLTEKIPNTPHPFTECGGVLNESMPQSDRLFTSPSYPLNYPSSSLCIWELVAPERHNIYVKFDVDTFELEFDKKCANDYVEVRDGDVNGPVLGKFCGTKDDNYPTALRSTREKLFVIFNSDSYYQYRGFHATFDILQPRVSIGCIVYNQLSTMPDSHRPIWQQEMELEDKSRFAPISRLMACRQYPQCNNSRPGPIIYTFEHFREDRNDKICIRWDLDEVSTTFKTDGCTKIKTNQTHTICACYTWGVVAVLGRLQSYKEKHSSIGVFQLGKNTFFSLLLVIFALVFTFLYLFLKDQWGAVIVEVFTRKEYDSGRIIQMHIVLSTLLAEIFYSIISFNLEASTGGCFIMAFIFYYILQSVFFWLFNYTLFLVSRVKEIFDSSRYNGYKIYLFIGYGVPFVVTFSISGLNYNIEATEKLCWLFFEGATVWGFSGVIVTLGVGSILILLNTMHNAKNLENGILLQEKCLKTIFIIFFILLTSVFGARAIQTKQYYAQYLFSLFNMLQGFAMAIMYCILRREDPIIRSNQVGPLAEWNKEDKLQECNDDKDSLFKDMSEAETSSDEENKLKEDFVNEEITFENLDKEKHLTKHVRLGPALSRVATPSGNVDQSCGVDADERELQFEESESESDQEILFRLDDADSYNMAR